MTTLDEFLATKGITVPAEYLSKVEDDVVLGSETPPLVQSHGDSYMIMGRIVSRTEIDERLKRLRHV